MIRPAGYSSDEDSDAEYESGFDDDLPDSRDSSLLSLQSVIETGTVESVRIFLSEIQDYENYKLSNGFAPAVFAAHLGEPDKLRYLLNHERDNYPKKFAQSKYDALIAVCSQSMGRSQHGFVDCLELLVMCGADPNFKDRYGVNPFMLACKNAPIEIIESLLKLESVLVNEIDNDGWSSLFYAVIRGDIDIVSLLLKNKADVNLLDRKHRYAYNIALDKNFIDIADLVKPSVIVKSETDEMKNARMPLYNTKNTVFQEEDVLYRNQVLEMVASTAADMIRYVPAFSKNKISLQQLLLFKTDDEVRDAGVLFSGHRKIMLNRIKEFHLGAWSPNSLGYSNFRNDDDGSGGLRTVLTFTASLHLQLHVLKCTLEYMKSSMRDCEPQNAEKIVQYLQKMKGNLLNFSDRLIRLRTSVDAIRDKCVPYLTSQILTDKFYS